MPIFDSQGREQVNFGWGINAISAGTTRAQMSEVVFSNSNAISFGLNADTFTAVMPILSSYEVFPIHNTGTTVISAGTNTSATVSFFPFELHNHVAAGWLNMIVSMSFLTFGTSSGTQVGGHSYGIYSRATAGVEPLFSTVTVGSWSYSIIANNSTYTINQPTTTNNTGFDTGSTTSAGVNITSQYTGLKLLQLPINKTLAPGVYWLGLAGIENTSNTSGGIRISYYGNAMALFPLAPIGSFTASFSTGSNFSLPFGGNWQFLQGTWSSTGPPLVALNIPPPIKFYHAYLSAIGGIPYMRFVTT